MFPCAHCLDICILCADSDCLLSGTLKKLKNTTRVQVGTARERLTGERCCRVRPLVRTGRCIPSDHSYLLHTILLFNSDTVLSAKVMQIFCTDQVRMKGYEDRYQIVGGDLPGAPVYEVDEILHGLVATWGTTKCPVRKESCPSVTIALAARILAKHRLQIRKA